MLAPSSRTWPTDGSMQPRDHRHRRGLAGAVRPEQAEHAAALRAVKLTSLTAGNARVELAEAARFEHGLSDTGPGEMFPGSSAISDSAVANAPTPKVRISFACMQIASSDTRPLYCRMRRHIALLGRPA